MPITNSLKPNLKLMVTMSGISSCGLWLLQGHVSANYSISKQNMYKSGILTYIAREERYAVCISRKTCARRLRNGSKKYGMNKEVVYPHSFRHRFAKNFLDRFNDLALLADLMGHESIETTRIYLRRTASEQQKIVDKVVNW